MYIICSLGLLYFQPENESTAKEEGHYTNGGLKKVGVVIDLLPFPF